MPTRLALLSDPYVWDSILQQHNSHLLQTYAWGEFKARFGWRVERVAVTDGDTPIAAAQILYRQIAPALTLAYVPRGPLVADSSHLPAFLESLKQHTRDRGAFFLKLEPDWHVNDARDEMLRRANLTYSAETVQPPATIQIDLTPDLKTILARMKSKWRYNIRLSGKKEINVRVGTAFDFNAFHELMRLTGDRDHFAIHSADYYRAAFELLNERENVRLLIAEYQNSPLAMIFVTAFAQQAIYLYGASSNTERNRMPNHALHWAAIQWAKARGCARYDLWGIPENLAVVQDDDANLPSSLYQFKQGFGGDVVRYTGAWDSVFDPIKFKLYQLARKLYSRGD